MDPIDEASSRRRERYQRWAASSDPLLKEIGEQLVRGQIRPIDLLAVPAYRELIQTGLTRLQREGARVATERSATGRALSTRDNADRDGRRVRLSPAP